MKDTRDSEVIGQELESVQIIFPELEINAEFTACTLKLPIHLESALQIQYMDHNNEKQNNLLLTSEINNLPPLILNIYIPEGYPNNAAPIVNLGNVSSWLPAWKIKEILNNLYNIWDSFRSPVIYTYIDYVKSNSEICFGLMEDKKTLLIDSRENYNILIKEDLIEKQNIFNNTTFTCEICQSEHKGTLMTEFPECGDLFCNNCLTDYFSHIIERGEVENVHCPSFKCTKVFQKHIDALNNEAESINNLSFDKFDIEFFKEPINSEILERFLSKDLINRYKTLYYRFRMEQYRRMFPLRVAECPRNICSSIFIKKNVDSKLAICPKCNFAFCSDCFHSWHGDINSCSIYMKKLPLDVILNWLDHNGNEPQLQSIKDREIVSNIVFKYGRKIVELAVKDYIADEQFNELIQSGDAGIGQCPSCSAYIQRSEGCNKMTCSKCHTFFCNICGDKLNKNDPYEHYNNPMSSCYAKLFQGMVNDEEGLQG